MHLNELHHIAIIASNYKVSKQFYTQVLGFKIINETYRAERNSYKLDLAINSQTQIELFSFPNAPARPSYPESCGLRHIAFQSENIDTVRTELLAQHIPVEDIRVDETTDKRFFFFTTLTICPLKYTNKHYNELPLSHGTS